MGSLLEKLEYLEETANELDTVIAGVVELKKSSYSDESAMDEGTLRERVEWYKYWVDVLFAQYGNAEDIEVTLANGQTAVLKHHMKECIICPAYTIHKYNYLSEEASGIPFVLDWNSCYSSFSVQKSIKHLDMSKIRINSDEKRSNKVSLASKINVESIILPPKFNFRYYGFGSISMDLCFKNGIKFGQEADMSSGWCSGSLNDSKACEVPVSMPDGFIGNLYMSKLKFSRETILHMFNALADLTGTNKTYILNIGTSNMALVTEEELNIAYAKGWEIT